MRLSVLKATSLLCDGSTAACEAVVAVSHCNEILLKSALALTNTVAFYLSTMLRLNALLRATLAGARFSREDPEQRRHSSCTSRDGGCSPLCWGGGTSVERVNFVHSVLPALPTLCRWALSTCSTILALTRVVVSVLCVNLRPTVSTILALCGCIRPVLLTLLTVTAYGTQLLDLSF